MKQIIKKTFVYKVYRKFIILFNKLKIEKDNKKYKQALEYFKDTIIAGGGGLDRKIKELYVKVKKEKRTFFIIRNANTKVGILGYVNVFLPHIAYALCKGYIPIIDMQKYETIYQENKENVWESFYEQPCGLGLSDIKKKDKVIYCNEKLWCRLMPSSNPLMSNDFILVYGRIYKEFIRFESRTKQYIENEFTKLIVNPQRTLAVIWRGTTYARGHAIGHPVQPSFDILKNDIDNILKEGKIDAIYIASDEKSIVDYFSGCYPNKIIVNKRFYYDTNNKVDYTMYNKDGSDLTADIFDDDNKKYKIGLTYLSSINIVANCDYFIGGACGGTTAALYMNNLKYKKSQVYDLGKYK